MRRLDASDLEERSRAESTVAVRLKQRAVDRAPIGGRHVKQCAGRIAEFGAEVPSLRTKHLDDRGCGAKPDVQLLERVVIDQVELDIFVAAALARRGVRLAKQVQLESACIFRRSLRRRRRRQFRLAFFGDGIRLLCRGRPREQGYADQPAGKGLVPARSPRRAKFDRHSLDYAAMSQPFRHRKACARSRLRPMRRFLFFLPLLAAAADYDVLIRNARVIDGAGNAVVSPPTSR